MLVDGDRVAVRLSIHGNDRPVFLGLPLRGNLAPWAQVDFLRVADGQIVEVQAAGDLPTLVEPLGHTALEAVAPAPYRLGLVRLTLQPGRAISRVVRRRASHLSCREWHPGRGRRPAVPGARTRTRR